MPLWFWPTHISPLAGDLLVKLLQCDPSQRISAAEALRHPWCRVGLEDEAIEAEKQNAPSFDDAHDLPRLPLSTAMSIAEPTDRDAAGVNQIVPLSTAMSVSSANDDSAMQLSSPHYPTPTSAAVQPPVNRQLFAEAAQQSFAGPPAVVIGNATTPTSAPQVQRPTASLLSASLANQPLSPSSQPQHPPHSQVGGLAYGNSHSSSAGLISNKFRPQGHPQFHNGEPSQNVESGPSSFGSSNANSVPNGSFNGGESIRWQTDRESMLQQQQQKEAEAMRLYNQQGSGLSSNLNGSSVPIQSALGGVSVGSEVFLAASPAYVSSAHTRGAYPAPTLHTVRPGNITLPADALHLAISPHVPFQSSPLHRQQYGFPPPPQTQSQSQPQSISSSFGSHSISSSPLLGNGSNMFYNLPVPPAFIPQSPQQQSAMFRVSGGVNNGGARSSSLGDSKSMDGSSFGSGLSR